MPPSNQHRAATSTPYMLEPWAFPRPPGPVFFRGLTESSIGDPSNPNSSRSLRSMNRKYPVSSGPVVKSTNRGGATPACVANRTRGAALSAHLTAARSPDGPKLRVVS